MRMPRRIMLQRIRDSLDREEFTAPYMERAKLAWFGEDREAQWE